MELNEVPPSCSAVPVTDSQADLPTPQRMAYARVLNWGTSVGLAGLFITFVLYAVQFVPPAIPLDEVSTHWGKPLDEFHRDTRIHERFGRGHIFSWLEHLHLGDFLVCLPIVLLACITMFCYAMILPYYIRQRSRLLLAIALAQLLVLVLAVAGVVAVH